MGNCRFDRKALRKGYEHAAIQDYTRRWNKVLRHDIRHSGKSAGCDGLGWVSVEEFLRNDHAWPLDEPKAYNYSARSYNEDVIHERRRTLMQGYCMVYIELQAHQKKTHDCAQYVLPSDMPEIHRFEKPEIYVAERLSRSSGLVRPVAIRSTAGHSFSGEHKDRLCVNIDQERMNIKFTKEMAFRLAGGYHVTRVPNVMSIVANAIMPGGGSGGRDHVFFGEFSCSVGLTCLRRDANYLLVLYVPVHRLLRYRSDLTYNGDVIVRDVVPFHEVQDLWIAAKSPEFGKAATNARKITSDRIVNEVVCQCELAERQSSPSVLHRS